MAAAGLHCTAQLGLACSFQRSATGEGDAFSSLFSATIVSCTEKLLTSSGTGASSSSSSAALDFGRYRHDPAALLCLAFQHISTALLEAKHLVRGLRGLATALRTSYESFLPGSAVAPFLFGLPPALLDRVVPHAAELAQAAAAQADMEKAARKKAEKERQKAKEEEKKREAAAREAEQKEKERLEKEKKGPPRPEDLTPVEKDKRAKALRKKLRLIEDLRAKPAAELNPDQLDKISQEAALNEELRLLGV